MEEGLLFTTDYMAEKVKFNIKDGKAVIDNKEFILDNIIPFTIRKKRLGRTRYQPFYLLKWDKIEPASFVVVDNGEYAEVSNGNTVKSLEVAFPDKTEGEVIPELLKETFDLRFMKHMKKYAAEGAGGKMKMEFKRWMIIPLALLVSGGIMFLVQGGRFF